MDLIKIQIPSDQFLKKPDVFFQNIYIKFALLSQILSQKHNDL